MGFHEVQHVREWWVWGIMIGGAIPFLVAAFFLHRAAPSAGGGARILLRSAELSMLVGLIPAGFLASLSMTTDVRADGVHVSIRPFLLRDEKVSFGDISSVQVRRYDPLREYGGWGIRYGRRGRALNMTGKRGVQIGLVWGGRLLLGSQRPEALARAIDAARAREEDPRWTRIHRPALADLQCDLSLHRPAAALDAAERLEGGADLDASDRMWLAIYRGVALDQLDRREEAARAFETARAIHAHGVAVDGTTRPIRWLHHLDRIRTWCQRRAG